MSNPQPELYCTSDMLYNDAQQNLFNRSNEIIYPSLDSINNLYELNRYILDKFLLMHRFYTTDVQNKETAMKRRNSYKGIWYRVDKPSHELFAEVKMLFTDSFITSRSSLGSYNLSNYNMTDQISQFFLKEIHMMFTVLLHSEDIFLTSLSIYWCKFKELVSNVLETFPQYVHYKNILINNFRERIIICLFTFAFQTRKTQYLDYLMKTYSINLSVRKTQICNSSTKCYTDIASSPSENDLWAFLHITLMTNKYRGSILMPIIFKLLNIDSMSSLLKHEGLFCHPNVMIKKDMIREIISNIFKIKHIELSEFNSLILMLLGCKRCIDDSIINYKTTRYNKNMLYDNIIEYINLIHFILKKYVKISDRKRVNLFVNKLNKIIDKSVTDYVRLIINLVPIHFDASLFKQICTSAHIHSATIVMNNGLIPILRQDNAHIFSYIIVEFKITMFTILKYNPNFINLCAKYQCASILTWIFENSKYLVGLLEVEDYLLVTSITDPDEFIDIMVNYLIELINTNETSIVILNTFISNKLLSSKIVSSYKFLQALFEKIRFDTIAILYETYNMNIIDFFINIFSDIKYHNNDKYHICFVDILPQLDMYLNKYMIVDISTYIIKFISNCEKCITSLLFHNLNIFEYIKYDDTLYLLDKLCSNNYVLVLEMILTYTFIDTTALLNVLKSHYNNPQITSIIDYHIKTLPMDYYSLKHANTCPLNQC